MKKALYIILLLAEAAVDFLAISLVRTNFGWIPCVVTIAVWAALLVWQILMLTKATDAELKRKIYRRIALVMLVPVFAGVIMLLCFICMWIVMM